jgi:uncharacterized protein YecE (DUF72 family)
VVLYLGCPVWACEHWKGTLFTSRAPRSEWLRQYSSVFNTVEGNSTFYALPSLETARRWRDEARPGFRFALKFPRSITHDRRLEKAERETAAFLEIADVLDSQRKLGPTFIQLPPDFSPQSFDVLERYLKSLPTHFPWAVEVRHWDWYDGGPNEWKLDELLRELRMDKVLFDSRPLFSKPPADEIEKISQGRKPRTPHRTTVTSQHPFLRLVGRNHLADVEPWINEWAEEVAGWLRDGRTPYVFTHAPDDTFAPQFARMFLTRLRECLPDLPDLPRWPGDSDRPRFEQRSLF